MRRLAAVFGALVSVAIAACVADEPETSGGGTTDDGGNDASSNGGDSSTPGDSAATDGKAGTTCDPSAAFVTITPLDTLNAVGSSSGIRLSADETTAYFTTDPTVDAGPGADIYAADRASPASPFMSPDVVYHNVNEFASSPTITPDGLAIYYASTIRGSDNGPAIQVLERPASNPHFTSPPIRLGQPINDTDDGGNLYASNFQPFVRADGQEMYFVSTRGQLLGPDIYRAHPNGDAGFTSVDLVTELNIFHSSTSPVVSADGLTIYFASTRTLDGGSETNVNVYVATRADPNGAFGNMRRLDELSVAHDTFPDFISRDMCTLYFHRGIANGGSGTTYALYSATKTP
ncbi:MAG: hypothetical protein ABI183_23020 [Polyangiaceae bacterium]